MRRNEKNINNLERASMATMAAALYRTKKKEKISLNRFRSKRSIKIYLKIIIPIYNYNIFDFKSKLYVSKAKNYIFQRRRSRRKKKKIGDQMRMLKVRTQTNRLRPVVQKRTDSNRDFDATTLNHHRLIEMVSEEMILIETSEGARAPQLT